MISVIVFALLVALTNTGYLGTSTAASTNNTTPVSSGTANIAVTRVGNSLSYNLNKGVDYTPFTVNNQAASGPTIDPAATPAATFPSATTPAPFFPPGTNAASSFPPTTTPSPAFIPASAFASYSTTVVAASHATPINAISAPAIVNSPQVYETTSANTSDDSFTYVPVDNVTHISSGTVTISPISGGVFNGVGCIAGPCYGAGVGYGAGLHGFAAGLGYGASIGYAAGVHGLGCGGIHGKQIL